MGSGGVLGQQSILRRKHTIEFLEVGEWPGREDARIGALWKKGRPENGSGEARGGFTSAEKAGRGGDIRAELVEYWREA